MGLSSPASRMAITLLAGKVLGTTLSDDRCLGFVMDKDSMETARHKLVRCTKRKTYACAAGTLTATLIF